MDKGTVIRSIVLFIALANQFLVSFGLYEIPGTAEEQTAFLSTAFTIIMAIIAWFKTTISPQKGKQQKDVLKANNLTNAK